MFFSLGSFLFFKSRKLMLQAVRSCPTPASQMVRVLFCCLLDLSSSASYLLLISVSALQNSKRGNLRIYNRSCTGLSGKTHWKLGRSSFLLQGWVLIHYACQIQTSSDSPETHFIMAVRIFEIKRGSPAPSNIGLYFS